MNEYSVIYQHMGEIRNEYYEFYGAKNIFLLIQECTLVPVAEHQVHMTYLVLMTYMHQHFSSHVTGVWSENQLIHLNIR